MKTITLDPMLAMFGIGGGEIVLLIAGMLVFGLFVAGMAALVVWLVRKNNRRTPSSQTAPPAPPSIEKTKRICPQCGKEMSPDAPQGLCPSCLMKVGLGSQFGDPGQMPKKMPAMPSDEIGKFFPQLEIIELLGQGGMGIVYKARQPALDRFVALKILSPELSKDPTFAERFSREAKALARLNHPNIVGVYDFGKAGDWVLRRELLLEDNSGKVIGDDKFGGDYRWRSAWSVPGQSNTATYFPKLQKAGKYHVELWYSAGKNRSTNAPWKISCTENVFTVSVDQTTNGGKWVRIGTALPFSSNPNEFVQLESPPNDAFPQSGRVIIADAVRFVPVEEDAPLSQSLSVEAMQALAQKIAGGDEEALQELAAICTNLYHKIDYEKEQDRDRSNLRLMRAAFSVLRRRSRSWKSGSFQRAKTQPAIPSSEGFCAEFSRRRRRRWKSGGSRYAAQLQTS